MRIDKEKLSALAALPDEELWRQVKSIAASHGLSLAEKTPSHEELEKLRGIVLGGSKLSLAGAMKIVNQYKKG